VTLPTYDEVIGRDGVSNENFNAYLLSLMRPEELNVLTIHAEVEGGICRDLFSDFLDAALARGVTFVPLGTFRETDPIDSGYLGRTEIVGREGWVACQSEVSA
jgi:undecaprenyl phosphate-alpha-L-ara4FN deformylase